jgi:hypothetical protein
VRFGKAVQDLRVEAVAHRARSGGAQQLTGADGRMDATAAADGRMDGPVTPSAGTGAGAGEGRRFDETGSPAGPSHPSDQLLADALDDEEAL